MIDLTPLPMEEAQQFWKDKVLLSPSQFRQLKDEVKTRAFAVSGIAKGDELMTVFQSMQRAIDKGTTLADFKKDCAEIFERRGWTGKRAWRIDNIFRTNIQTAYNVGRYKQMQEVALARPYWQYSAVNDSRTRPTHAAMNGKVFRHDHPFWDKWYPPNGFRCRCGVNSLSENEVNRDGLTVETKDPTGMLIEPIDPRTGYNMPARLLMPDVGFDHNPGKAVWGGIVDEKMKRLSNLKQFQWLRGATDYGLPAAKNLKNLPAAPTLLPSLADLRAGGMSNREAANYYLGQFHEAFGVEKANREIFNVHGETVIVSDRLVTGKGGRVKITKGDRGQYIPLYLEAIINPDEIWLTPMTDDAGQILLRRRHLKYWRGEKENVAGFAVMEIDGGVWNGISVYDAQGSRTNYDGENILDGPNGYRRGVLLYPGRKK